MEKRFITQISFLKLMLGFWLILFIPVFLASTLHAEIIDSSYELAIAKAVNKIERNDFAGAIEILNDVLRTNPDDERATLYLGIALSRLQNKEAERILKKALLLNPDNPRTNLELGIYYYNMGIHGEAADYFENTVQLAPDTEFAVKAAEYQRLLKPEATPKRWALNLSIGSQYDNNVVLDSDASPLPEGISRKSDWRAVFYLKGLYNFLSTKSFEGSASYSFYQSLHADLSDFNVTSNLFDLTFKYNVLSNLSLKGEYSFEYILVGGDTYDYAHAVSPTLIISEGGGFFTEIQYVYKDSHYKESDLFTDNPDRTGFNNLISIMQQIPIANVAKLRAGYSYDEDNVEASHWDYSGNKFLAEVNITMPAKIYLGLYGEYYIKDFEGIYPTTGKERHDWISTGNITATKLLSEQFSVTLGQLYANNKSSIEIFDYERAITSLFINVRF